MPPKSKRKAARKSAATQDSSDFELQGSSPARPASKRRKVNGARSSTRLKTPSSEADLPRYEDSHDESEAVSQTDLIDSVVSYLQISKEHVIAVNQFANEGQDDAGKVNAFAKIAGREWTYFVREQSVNIGRPPDERQSIAINGVGASSPIQDMKDILPVHIDLGPSKIVSRHHASIFYDGDFPDGGGWHVRVNGRNGVRVNNHLLKRGARQQITSGTILEIAGTQMMFVTPADPVNIDPSFIERAKQLATAGDEVPSSLPLLPELQPAPMLAPGYPSLAPAPPEFKRAVTPPPQMDGRNQRGVFDSKAAMSPMYGRGMMMESTQEIDYARDSAKDLKPPYSYANMIAQAIFSNDEEKMTLANIYSFIADKYAFYRHSNSGWQNSIRHNLSLNKAFQKVPRRTDEPGKGMKWQIAPESRQEYWKKQAKRTNGSAPSSPASSKEVNPNFRGPNGQNLGYDTSMVSSFSAKDVGGPMQGGKIMFQPQPQQYPPQYGSGPNLGPPNHQLPHMEAVTPQRRRGSTINTLPDTNYHSQIDDSPLPHRTTNPNMHPHNQQVYTLPTPIHSSHQHSPSHPHNHQPHLPQHPNHHQNHNHNMTLSSSYLDTPFTSRQHSSSQPHYPSSTQHPSSSLITPAPMRQNPRLAPPSTLVAPSKFMPESSPAGPGLFWKGIMAGGTPATLPPDLSPVKTDPLPLNGRGNSGRDQIGRGAGFGGVLRDVNLLGNRDNEGHGEMDVDTHHADMRKRRARDIEMDRGVMSSSPPPMDGIGGYGGVGGSPSKAPLSTTRKSVGQGWERDRGNRSGGGSTSGSFTTSVPLKREGSIGGGGVGAEVKDEDKDAGGDVRMRSRSASAPGSRSRVGSSSGGGVALNLGPAPALMPTVGAIPRPASGNGDPNTVFSADNHKAQANGHSPHKSLPVNGPGSRSGTGGVGGSVMTSTTRNDHDMHDENKHMKIDENENGNDNDHAVKEVEMKEGNDVDVEEEEEEEGFDLAKGFAPIARGISAGAGSVGGVGSSAAPTAVGLGAGGMGMGGAGAGGRRVGV